MSVSAELAWSLAYAARIGAMDHPLMQIVLTQIQREAAQPGDRFLVAGRTFAWLHL